MSFILLIVMILFTSFCGLALDGGGYTKMSMFFGLLFFPCLLVLYFWPAGLAFFRSHQNKMSVAVLNLFLGWTFLGWVVALVWAYKREATIAAAAPSVPVKPYERPSPQPAWKLPDPETKRCPYCAEDVKAAAIKCKHCGSDLTGGSAQAAS